MITITVIANDLRLSAARCRWRHRTLNAALMRSVSGFSAGKPLRSQFRRSDRARYRCDSGEVEETRCTNKRAEKNGGERVPPVIRWRGCRVPFVLLP